jgi:hypothetical protein
MNGRRLICSTFVLLLATSLCTECTWMAGDVPEDTKIRYAWTPDRGTNHLVTISADGTVNCVISDAEQPDSYTARGASQISRAELEQIVLKFAKLDFFSLRVRDGCVYNVNRPPDFSACSCWVVDAGSVTISATIRGRSNYIEYGPGPGCDPDLDAALGQLEKMILMLERVVELERVIPTPRATLSPAILLPTPTPSR